MKTSRTLVVVAVVCAAAAFSARAQLLGDTPSVPSLELAILNTFPPPTDDPLLDSSGNVVMDSDGHPVSDPNEQFHQVKPFQFDPGHTWLVQAAWLNGIGCAEANGCTGGDPNDHHNEGLLLAKSGPTPTNAAAGAELKKVRGTTVVSLGYDIRKPEPNPDPRGSHCGAGAPRFNLYLENGSILFVGCLTGIPETTGATGWTRLRWTVPAVKVQRIQIIFDEGPDTGPDNFGVAILDNIYVNGQIVGAGPTDAR